MKRLGWITVAALWAPHWGLGVSAQSGPAPIILAGIELETAAFVPHTALVLCASSDSLYVYDRRRQTLRAIAAGEFSDLTVSPRGNRVAFSRTSAGEHRPFVWVLEIDARSGIPRAVPLRLSVASGDAPRFSPTGAAIAFHAKVGDGPDELRVANAGGGRERVVASFDARVVPFWSADGRYLLVRYRPPGQQAVLIRRVPLAGSAPPRVDTLVDAERVLQADGASIIYQSMSGRTHGQQLVYRNARGDTTHVPISEDAFLGDWSAAEQRVPVIGVTYRTTAHLLDLASGRMRDITPAGMQARAPRWSPDGARLALEVSRDSQFTVAVMDADGAGVRTYPLPVAPINVQLVWSPDGRMVAFRTMTALFVLDLASSTGRQLGAAIHPHHLAWRPNSRSLVVARIPDVAVRPLRVQLFETPLDAPERQLVDVNASFPDREAAGYFASAEAFVLLNPERFVVHPTGGHQRLPGEGARSGAPGQTADGNWLLFGIGQGNAPVRQLELIDVANAITRTIELSFLARTFGFSRPALLPDHRSAIVLGREESSRGWKFFRVPFDGSESRMIATIRGYPQAYHFDLSPSGATLAFAADVPARSTIEELLPRTPQ